ncbi:MAG: dTDP-4-dehydrorhamnose reductase [Thermodesulfobacteriota bacterium]
MNKSEKILITGAHGQLGTDVASVVKTPGRAIACYGREDLDITDKGAVFSVMEKEAPSIIINTAAYTKVDLAEKEREKAFAVNCEGAKNLALASSATGAVLIHISTDFVFDGTKTTPYKEEDKTAPLGVYGQSKLAGEEAVRESCPPHIIIRTSWLYGAHGPNFVKTIMRLAGEQETLRVVSDQIGTPTWTVDLAGVITQMIEGLSGKGPQAPPFGLYHYSNEGTASWYDFALAIVEEARGMGMKLKCGTVEPIPTSAYPTPAARPAYSVLDTTKIKKTLNVSMPHWRTSLINMLKKLREERG